MGTTTKDRALFWSEQGEIACGEHTPYRGSDTWVWGRWRKITATEAEGFEREAGRPLACETCAAIARQGAQP
jgi:hypothetical protein